LREAAVVAGVVTCGEDVLRDEEVLELYNVGSARAE
jgi:hypothetical protein